MIRWPIRSAKAVIKLFKSTQDIDIYVEDQGDEQFYTKLFQIVSPPEITITRVVALGCSSAVIEAAKGYRGDRTALFLIDGDLSWVRGEPAPNVRRLYRLECYCIENLLLQESLVAEVCAEEMMCNAEEAKKCVGFTDWLISMRCLVPLFARFAVLNQMEPQLPTVGKGFAPFVEAEPKYRSPCLSQSKVVERISEIDELVTNRFGVHAEAAIRTVEQRIAALGDELLAVSGKDFLLPLLFFHLKRVSNTRISLDQFRFRLGCNSSAERLCELARALEEAA